MPEAAVQSLRGRLLRTLVPVSLLAWVLAAAATWVDAGREIGALLDAHLAQSARLLIAQSAHELEEVDFEDLNELAPYGQKVAFQVWDGNGALVLRSADAPTVRFSRALEGLSDARVGKEQWRVFSGRDRDARTLVQVAERYAVRDRIARQVAINTLWPLALVLPLLALALGWVVTRALRPLADLGAEVAGSDPHALAPISRAGVPSEAAPLVARLNDLFARVRQSLEQERRFTANAAHELRNPLAALRTQAEVARHSRDPVRVGAALDQVIVACDRLARLVDQLLLLARVEEQALRMEPVDLATLARRVVAAMAPQALGEGHDLGIGIGGARGAAGPADGRERGATTVPAAPLIVQGNAALLESMLRNLVDNALRHGGRAVAVDVSVRGEGGSVRLRVEDDGAGVPPAELAALGARFQRASDARSPGSGLGLALARRIAECHAGRLEFGAAGNERGFRVDVTLPRAASMPAGPMPDA
jgi:two-component system sensor histidine kinase QseC